MEKLLREKEPYVLCEVIDDYLARRNCTSGEMQEFMTQIGYESYTPDHQKDSTRWTKVENWSKRPGDEDILFAKRPLPNALLSR